MTLLEVTIVMLIIGLMAAIAAPRFSRAMHATQVRTAALHIASHIDYVRRTAINQNITASLTYDETNASYQSPEVDFADRIGKPIAVDLHEEYDASLQLQANFDTAKTISFDVEGVPMVGTTVMQSGWITVSSPGVPSYHVIIAPGTGYASMISDAELTAVDGYSGASN